MQENHCIDKGGAGGPEREWRGCRDQHQKETTALRTVGVWGDGTDLKFNLVGLPGDAGVTTQPMPLEADGKKTKLFFPFPLPSGAPLCTQVTGSAERSQFLMDQGLGK